MGSSSSSSPTPPAISVALSRTPTPSGSPLKQQIPVGTSSEVPISADNQPVGVVRIPDQTETLELTILLASSLNASNEDLRDGVVAEITLQDASGQEITSFDQPLTICLAPEQATTDGACLSYYDESTGEWVCQDKCLKEENGLLCGETDHLTSFALLLSGGAGNECEERNYIYSWLTLGFVCATLLIVLLAVLAIELHIRLRRVHRRRRIRSINTATMQSSNNL